MPRLFRQDKTIRQKEQFLYDMKDILQMHDEDTNKDFYPVTHAKGIVFDSGKSLYENLQNMPILESSDGDAINVGRDYYNKTEIDTQVTNLETKITTEKNARESADTNIGLKVGTLEADKANINGAYEDMAVGELLPSGAVTSETFIKHTTANGAVVGGTAKIESIKGNTIKVVQTLKITNPREVSGITFQKNDDGSLRIYGTATSQKSQTSYISPFNVQKIPAEHWVLFRLAPNSSSVKACFIGLNYSGSFYYDNSKPTIIKAPYGVFYISFTWEEGAVIDETYFPYIYDLTAMFGSGNEPTTADGFAQKLGYANIASVPYFDYTEGKLINVTANKLVSKNADGTSTSELTLPIITYFPNGMNGIGSVQDELTKDKAVKRFGVVNLGSLNYDKFTDKGNGYFRAVLPLIKDDTLNLITPKHNAQPTLYSTQDGKITSAPWHGIHNICIFDYAEYEGNVSAFKSAMQGVMLYYELKTPTETTITPPLALDYKAYEGGTEEIQTATETSPITLNVNYNIDVVACLKKMLNYFATNNITL